MNYDKELEKIPLICALVMGCMAVIAFFMPNLAVAYDGQTVNFSGACIAFGVPAKINADALLAEMELPAYMRVTVALKYFTISPVIVTYLLAIGGTVCIILIMTGKFGLKTAIIATVCFTAAAVLFFLSKQIVLFNGELNIADQAQARGELKYNVGVLLGGIMSIISAVASLSFTLCRLPIWHKQ